MKLSGIDLAFWFLGLAVNIILLVVLFVRGRAKSFPIFTTIIACSVLRTIVLYALIRRGTHAQYFYSYWSFGLVDDVLEVGVFYEAAAKVFRPTGTWARDTRSSFAAVLVVSALVALVMTWMAVPSPKYPIANLVLKGNFFSAVLLSELFLGTMVLSASAGLPWKTHVARIAQGFGVFAAVEIVAEAVHIVKLSQGAAAIVWVHLRIETYLLCVGYWIVTLWREAPAPRELPENIRRDLVNINRMLEDISPWR